jgi:hypothetical protein
MAEDAGGFLSRWARRKAAARGGTVAPVAPAEPAESVVPAAAVEPGHVASSPPVEQTAPATEPPPPTLADVALLTRDSDYSRFVGAGVGEDVKRAALKKLFTDPRFNVMDGLDTYIDDYGKPDPIPMSMLRRMNQSKMLRLFDDDESEEEEGATTQASAPAETSSTEAKQPSDDKPDLRLQQDDVAGRPGPDPGTGT